MFLSCIIPVYNAESYIRECLDSLLQQDISTEDYEIICVNDGSKDGSLSILRSYAQKHSNIVIVDKENGGVTTARNAGLEIAQGNYIWFIDADDFIQKNSLCMLQYKILKSGCDRLVFGAYLFTDSLTQEETAQSEAGLLPVNAPWYDAVVWRSLIRRDFLLKNSLYFRYPELTHGEDGLFMYEVTLCKPVTVECEAVIYFYREHSGSAETTKTFENQMRKIRSYIRITGILREYWLAIGTHHDGDANKFMSFLWMTLYEISKLSLKQARPLIKELKQYNLYPMHRLPYCNANCSPMISRTNITGKLFDKVYLNLHRPWGYHTMRLLHKLIKLLK